MASLSVGVLGLGLGRIHVSAYADSPHVGRLVICDENETRRQETRQAHPQIAADYATLDEMLASEQLDAVSVVTPDHLHRQHAERCLAAGCHLLLTKPLATNLDDARAIVIAAEKAGRLLMVAHERRFHSHTLALRAILDAGELGELIHLRVDAISDKRRQFARSPWYASAESGRTAIVGTGIHEVDLLRHLVGKPIEQVSAFSNRLGTLDFPKDKTTAAIFQFAGGTIGQVTVSYEAHWPPTGEIDDHFRIIASRGVVFGNRIARDGQPDWEGLPTDPNPIRKGSQACVHAFIESIVEGKPVPVTGQDAFASLAAAVAADQSAALGRAVRPEAF